MNLTRKTALVLALFVLGSAVAESAQARGRARIGVGLYFGVPLVGLGWYGSPYYPYYPYYPSYPASVVYVPSQPTTYIQQEGVQASPPAQQGYWYYCGDARAYYPYVKECPGGWQRVAPQPSN